MSPKSTFVEKKMTNMRSGEEGGRKKKIFLEMIMRTLTDYFPLRK